MSLITIVKMHCSAVGAAKNQFIDALYDAIKGMGMILPLNSNHNW
jgi:hypothetical protein